MTSVLEDQVGAAPAETTKITEWLPSFKCSTQGQESALCVLQVKEEGGTKLPLIVIHIVPKFWFPKRKCESVLLRIDPAATEPLIVTVPETGRLVIQGPHARLVAESLKKKFDASIDPKPVDPVEEDPNQSDSRGALFEPMPDVKADSIAEVVPSSGSHMQALLALAVSVSNKLEDLLIKAPGLKSDGSVDDLLHYLSRNPVLMRQPAMANLLKQLFVIATKEALKRRKPDFRNRVERLNAVRGSIVLNDIPRRRAQRAQSIECEFDELEMGSEWFSLIRCAARTIISDAAVNEETTQGEETKEAAKKKARQDPTLLGAIEIDRALTDAPLLSTRNALNVLRNLRMSRKHKHWIRSTDFAKSVLLNTQPLGGEWSSDSRERGFAAHVYIPTSELFEQMLVESTRSPVVGVNTNPWVLHHYSSTADNDSVVTGIPKFKLRKNQVANKSPDLISKRAQSPHPQFVVDAKYKERPGSMNSMPMTDQYQQFAYALIANLPTLFLYAESEDTSSSVDIDSTTVNQVKVGLAAVPFPKPMEIQGSGLSDSWKHRMNKRIQSLLGTFVSDESTDNIKGKGTTI